MARQLRRAGVFAVGAAVSACLFSSPAAAQEAAEAGPVAGASGELGSRISLELQDAKVMEVLAALAGILEVKLQAPPSDRLITTTLLEVPAIRALQVVCETTGCVSTLGRDTLVVRWVAEPEQRAAVEEQPAQNGRAAAPRGTVLRGLAGFDEKLSMNLVNAELTEVLAVFHKVLGGRIEVDERLGGKVTVELVAVPAWQALEHICAVHGCRFQVDKEPLVVRVVPR